MYYNKYHQPVFTSADLADVLMSGQHKHVPLVTDQPVSWPPELELHELSHVLNDETQNVENWDAQNQGQWFMPREYRDLDIAELILNRCTNDAELQRAASELLLYAERGLLPLLNYMHYLVDIMKQHNIVWGVGRGSSTASFVLYLLEVHQINSLYYDLDITEFLK